MYSNIISWTQQNNWPEITDDEGFSKIALKLFAYQYQNNKIYQQFADGLGRSPDRVTSMEDIPFLPVSFFKSHTVLCQEEHHDMLHFESSGTTGSINSKHFVPYPDLYERSFNSSFCTFYGTPEDYIFLCLLPSYIERKHSSLVYMANRLIQQSGRKESGFFLDQTVELAEKLQQFKAEGKKIILLGVTFALIDFATAYPMDLSGVIVMETGGMKGRKEEWTRQQVHQHLQERWLLPQIHSEYGMTEMLSQAYAQGKGLFACPAHLKILLRDINDPLEIKKSGSGLINIIDLANVHSCAFLATEDIGKLNVDGSFEVLGRADHSALRGCSLLVV